MTKREFEELIGEEVSANNYMLIELVYCWHPSIGNVGGKRQVAELYKVGGIEIFKDMRKAALISQEYDRKIRELRRQKSEIERMIEEVTEEYEKEIEER